MTTISLSVCDTTPRESRLRTLALTAGIALVRWAYRRPVAPTHEHQALRLAAQSAAARQCDALTRYGIVQ